jgi:hypothetical protein
MLVQFGLPRVGDFREVCVMGTDIHGVWQKRAGKEWQDIPSMYEQERHYSLFAVLAGVRNGYGFAGIRTGEPVTPIAEPRGIPADFACVDDEHPVASFDVIDDSRREEQERDKDLNVWLGDHSHSWLTGAEILAWAETAPEVVKCGVLTREVYEKWDGKSCPENYNGGVMGARVVTIDDSGVARATTPNWTHVSVHWDSSLKEDLAYFFDEVARLVAEHGEIRFVFGFDS